MNFNTLTKNKRELLSWIVSNQNSLNAMASGQNWVADAADKSRVDFVYAAIDELVAEFIPCTVNWKWWSKSAFNKDLENAKLELVDVFHFLLSEALTVSNAKEEAVLEELIESVDSYQPAIADIRRDTKLLIMTLVKTQTSAASFKEVWALFFNLCVCVGLDLTALTSIYRAKSELNRFRQSHGYKLGTYHKMWGGVEDNAVMMSYLKTCNYEFTSEEINRFFDMCYQKEL